MHFTWLSKGPNALRVLGLVVLSACMMPAQSLSVGVKGGLLVTDPAERYDEGKRYVVGPSIEVGLPWRLAVEVNALYSRFGTSLTPAFTSPGLRGNAWELPVLGKYYFTDKTDGIRPFVSSGYSFRKIWFESDRGRSGIGGQFGRRSNGRDGGSSDLDIGAVVGGGVSLNAWRLRVAPEFRYTRWGGPEVYPSTNRNQAQVLLGISF